jgi:hypothetical protein
MMSQHYCDYMHKRLPDFRLVLPMDAAMPASGNVDDWELVRTRPAAHLSQSGRAQVDADGFAIIRVHVPFDEVKSL